MWVLQDTLHCWREGMQHVEMRHGIVGLGYLKLKEIPAEAAR